MFKINSDIARLGKKSYKTKSYIAFFIVNIEANTATFL